MKPDKPSSRSDLGRKGEELAEKFLKKHRYRILERGWRCRYGEIDIVARQGEVLCFIEVRTRADMSYGRPEESITRTKINRLTRAAQHYVRRKRLHDCGVRFDVVCVDFEKGEPEISLISEAFEQLTGD